MAIGWACYQNDMIRTNLVAAMLVLLLSVGFVRAEDPAPPYDVVWTSPSVDAVGSMPMGNGEVGINLWAQDDGTLNFYISRSDSFSEIGRLLKVGQVRVTLSPNPFAAVTPFRQHLVLHDGVCEITAGDVKLRVFVDADQPVVHVVGESGSPLSVTAEAVTWRGESRTLPNAEARSAWSMQRAPYPLVESADVFPAAPAGTVAWYHRNDTSVVPSTIEVQSLQPIAGNIHDVLLHRTFGGWITGEGFVPGEGHAIRTAAPVKAFAVRVAAPCVQGEAADWTRAATEAAQRSADPAVALARTVEWWHGYWDRSWVVTDAGTGIVVPANDHPLRVGFDSNHQNEFPGTLAQTATYDRTLTGDEVAKLAATGHDRPPAIPGGTASDFSRGFTLAAWVKPDRLASGRIFDKLTAGAGDGFLFDNHPGSTLRLDRGRRDAHGEAGFAGRGTMAPRGGHGGRGERGMPAVPRWESRGRARVGWGIADRAGVRVATVRAGVRGARGVPDQVQRGDLHGRAEGDGAAVQRRLPGVGRVLLVAEHAAHVPPDAGRGRPGDDGTAVRDVRGGAAGVRGAGEAVSRRRRLLLPPRR